MKGCLSADDTEHFTKVGTCDGAIQKYCGAGLAEPRFPKRRGGPDLAMYGRDLAGP